jgi:hypothetical protein
METESSLPYTQDLAAGPFPEPLCFLSAPFSAYSSTPKTEAVHSSEISVNFYQTTPYHIPEMSTLYSHRRENCKSKTEEYSPLLHIPLFWDSF